MLHVNVQAFLNEIVEVHIFSIGLVWTIAVFHRAFGTR